MTPASKPPRLRLRDPARRMLLPVGATLALALTWGACTDADRAADAPQGPYRAEVDEGLGIAVVVLLDNSGSMEDAAPGDERPKNEVARGALRAMLSVTDSFVASRPDLPVRIALFRFAGSVDPVLAIQDYDPAAVDAALETIPGPDGSTAIGDALRRGTEELYRSGVFRKHLIVVTDGENTRGLDPASEAREIHRRSEASVRMHFVAFDTDPEKFGFLSEVGGQIFAAADAAALRTRLDSLYRTQILAEAMDEVEPAPVGR